MLLPCKPCACTFRPVCISANLQLTASNNMHDTQHSTSNWHQLMVNMHSPPEIAHAADSCMHAQQTSTALAEQLLQPDAASANNVISNAHLQRCSPPKVAERNIQTVSKGVQGPECTIRVLPPALGVLASTLPNLQGHRLQQQQPKYTHNAVFGRQHRNLSWVLYLATCPEHTHVRAC